MKQYTDKDQTAKLIELGFPRPQSIVAVDVDYSIRDHTIYNAYSIGELIGFLEANTDISIWYDGKSGYWCVDYDLRRLALNEHLINALYFACERLKGEKSI